MFSLQLVAPKWPLVFKVVIVFLKEFRFLSYQRYSLLDAFCVSDDTYLLC